jgi:hypothetical protein
MRKPLRIAVVVGGQVGRLVGIADGDPPYVLHIEGLKR